MLYLLQQTVNPMLSLKQAIKNWDDISFALREAPRERPMKLADIEKNGPFLS